MKVGVVIPALNEAETIGEVVRGVPRVLGAVTVVVDGGSVDGTQSRAREAGALVIVETRRGYGRACLAGAERAAELGVDVIAFIDAALAEDPAELQTLIAPIRRGELDLVVGSRTLGCAEPGALRPLQRSGNRLAAWLMTRLYGQRYTDLGSMRAITCEALWGLGMRELGHGWPAEMQVKAARQGLRVGEVPIRYRRRRSGRSKVSGSLPGSLRAGGAILRIVLGGSR